MTLCGLRPHVLVLGPLLAAACSSAPSESPADQPVPPAAAPGIVNVDARGLRILNMRDFRRALMREMPEETARAGVDGFAKVWLHVSVRGRILERRIHTTSGNRTLDRAILQAARILRFSAEGRSDPVWVLIDLGYKRR